MRIFLTFWLLMSSVWVFGASPDIYVLGCGGTYLSGAVRVWKNGSQSYIKDGGKYKSATSIFVNGGDVYVGGYVVDGDGEGGEGEEDVSVATIWKNGVATRLSDGQTQSNANSVCVANGKVYVGGVVFNGRKDVATIWVDGVARSLTSEQSNASVNYVSVIDSVVYACGYENIDNEMDVAKVWVGEGRSFNLSSGRNSGVARRFALYGADVYSLGSEFLGYDDIAKKRIFVPRVWRNLKQINLVRGFDVTLSDIAIDGLTVYIVGCEIVDGNHVARIWANGAATTLRGGSCATSIKVVGGDVYVAGVKSGEGDKADGDDKNSAEVLVWKNGELLYSLGEWDWIKSAKIFVADKKIK